MSDAQILPSQQVAALSPEAHAHWKLTGEINPKASAPPPDAPHQDLVDEPADPSTYAESSPDKPVDQAPEIAGSQSAASEPATPKKKSNAETRKADLNAEILALKAERDRLASETARLKAEPKPEPKADVTPAVVAPSATPEPKNLAAFVASPDLTKPRIDEVEFFAQFPDAKLADYQDYRENYAESRRSQQVQVEGRIGAIQSQFQSRLKSVQEGNPKIWETVPKELKTAKATGVTLDAKAKRTAWNDMAREWALSEHADAFLEHFSAHPEDAHHIAGLPDERSVIRAMAALETRLTSEPVNPQKAVRPRTTTSAPEPPSTTVGRRTQGVIDDAEGAIQRKDAGSYIAIMNRRESAGAR